MSNPLAVQEEYLSWFDRETASLKKGCDLLADFVEEILTQGKVMFHAVHARVKDRDSIIRKFRKKDYTQPREDLTDAIGVRIYTYFKEDTPSVEQVIRSQFDVDDARSVDKASILLPKEFGYTSRHLICHVSEQRTDHLTLRNKLGGLWFEIQIRTVLEHAWAEVEHELVYKAETDVPDLIRRRFNAAAATLEIVDREFAGLRQFEKQLITERSVLIASNPSQKLNRAWFFACLDSSFPSPVTWDPNPKLNAFYRDKEIRILEVLSDLGVRTVEDLSNLLGNPRIVEAASRYLALKNCPTEAPSHLVIALIAVVLAGQAIPPSLSHFFDEELKNVVGLILQPQDENMKAPPETREDAQPEEQAEPADPASVLSQVPGKPHLIG